MTKLIKTGYVDQKGRLVNFPAITCVPGIGTITYPRSGEGKRALRNCAQDAYK